MTTYLHLETGLVLHAGEGGEIHSEPETDGEGLSNPWREDGGGSR